MTLRFATLFALSTLLAACGGDDDGGGVGSGPVTQEQYTEGCRIDCEHRVECGDTTDPLQTCIDNCAADYPEVAGWLRADATVAITQCFGELDCAANDNQCMAECIPTAAHAAYEAQCREVFGPCGASPDELDGMCETTPMPTENSDDTGIFCLMTPAVMNQMLACIPDGTACQAGLTCLEGVLNSVGFD